MNEQFVKNIFENLNDGRNGYSLPLFLVYRDGIKSLLNLMK